MLSKEQVETLIKETQIKEKLNSPRLVLDKYPELEAVYNMACLLENQNDDDSQQQVQ